MKTNHVCIDNYPWHNILITNLLSVTIYAIGAIVLSGIGIIPVILYLALIVFLEFKLLKVSCTKCYYYDRYCAFGKGKLSTLFFKKEDPSLFLKKDLSWYALLPDMLVLFIPLLLGIYLLMQKFNWIILILLLFMVFLSTFGNGWVRGSMACKKCNQRELGCPADKFFNKSKN